MVKITATYGGGLHCEVEHGPSGSKIETDAPKDNMGKGEKFSPTDLVGAALTSCILTTIAISAERDGVTLKGAKAEVTKVMSPPPRKIASLNVTVTIPASVPADYREKLEQVGRHCPVHRSLHEALEANIEFQYR